MQRLSLYVYLWMVVLIILTACNSSTIEELPFNEEEQTAIGFTAKVQGSRAVADIDSVQNGFGVWAFYTNNKNTNVITYMENLKVEYKEGRWDYGDPKYWLVDTKFSFVATYPYVEKSTYTTKSGAVELTLSETPSNTDYLVALKSVDTGDIAFDPSKSVQLQFKHLLSNVSLNVWRDGAKHQNDQMRIKRVILSNIRKAGTYTSVTEKWAPTNEELAMEYINDTFADSDNIDGAIIQNDGKLDTDGADGFRAFSEKMLLPQTIDASNSVSLKIEYELKRQNAADWEEAELETSLPSITWNAGQRYTYNVVLSSVTDITVYYIYTKVDPWGTPQVGGTVIIK